MFQRGVKSMEHCERHSGIEFEGKWGVCNVPKIIGQWNIMKGTLVLGSKRISLLLF